MISDTLDSEFWQTCKLVVEEDSQQVKQLFYYQNTLKCIKLLLHYLLFQDKLV